MPKFLIKHNSVAKRHVNVFIMILLFLIISNNSFSETIIIHNWYVNEVEEEKKQTVDMVYPTDVEFGLIIFFIDSRINCDARLVFTDYLWSSVDEAKKIFINNKNIPVSWELARRRNNNGLIKTNGYVRIALTKFRQKYLHTIENIIAEEGNIKFQFSINKRLNSLPRKLKFSWNSEGLNEAMTKALNNCLSRMNNNDKLYT